MQHWMVLERIRPSTARVVAGLVVLALLGARIVVGRNARHDAAVAEGRRLLLEGDFAGASASFEPVQDSSRVGAQARAGLALARGAGDESGGAALAPADAKAAIEGAGVPLLSLLDSAMRARHYGAALGLGRLAGDGGDALGRVYQAAALVELGRDDEARAVIAAHPGAF